MQKELAVGSLEAHLNEGSNQYMLFDAEGCFGFYTKDNVLVNTSTMTCYGPDLIILLIQISNEYRKEK